MHLRGDSHGQMYYRVNCLLTRLELRQTCMKPKFWAAGFPFPTPYKWLDIIMSTHIDRRVAAACCEYYVY